MSERTERVCIVDLSRAPFLAALLTGRREVPEQPEVRGPGPVLRQSELPEVVDRATHPDALVSIDVHRSNHPNPALPWVASARVDGVTRYRYGSSPADAERRLQEGLAEE